MTMPRVMGKAVEEARNELAQLGLKSEVEYQDSDTVPAGEVMNSSVGTGEEVLTGSTVIASTATMTQITSPITRVSTVASLSISGL